MSKIDYKKLIADVQDFPIPGILFRDITPLLQDGEAYLSVCNDLAKLAKDAGAEVIMGPESRGFIFACPIATMLNVGFVPIRKPGKLPRETVDASYELEYGHNTISIHKDAIKKGQKVFIVDDLIATGGTLKAAIELIEKLGGEVVGIGALIELVDLKGRQVLEGYNVQVLLKY